MDYINDFIYVNKESLMKTIKSLKNSWPIIFVGFVYGALSVVVVGVLNLLLIGPLSILSGIISAIIISALFSNYLYLLTNVIRFGKVGFDDFKNGFTYYLRKIYSILFIFYIARLLLSTVLRVTGPLGISMMTLVSLAAFVLLNALPETIYQKYYGPVDSISYSFSFITENPINWGLPNLILFGVLYPMLSNVFPIVFMITFRRIPGITEIVVFLIGQLLFNFGMIYRGHLFDLLSTSTKRKRDYMRKF